MTFNFDKIVKLSQLTIKDPKKLSKNLEDITKHFEILDNIDTTDIETTLQVTGLCNVSRQDGQ